MTCVAHEETRQVTTQQNSTFPTKTLVHYHANPTYIWMKDDSFRPESLQIPQDVERHLQQEHRIFLSQYFMI